MWKLLVSLLYIFYVFLDSIDGAAFIIPSEEKPPAFADQEGCYVSSLNRVLPYNKPYSPQDGKSCVQYTCNSDNTTSGYSCGVIGVSEPCSIVPGNLFLPYPQCCDGVSCPKQPNPEDPEVEKTPEEEDQPADSDTPVDPEQATDYPGEEESAHTKQPTETEDTSNFEVYYIPQNNLRTPMCAYVIHSLLGVRDDIPPNCLPAVGKPAETADEDPEQPKEKLVATPEEISVVDPVIGDNIPPNRLPIVDEPTELADEDPEQPKQKTLAKPVEVPIVDPGREPVIGPVAEPIVFPSVGPGPQDEPSGLNHQPLQTLPVEPPKTVDS
ncbi:single domain von willebrand factor type C domain-containing protein [Phthorimaea operculella]|nr:single domain von willebrand factor type C domain-containing protein [Phthorimaea operculella]